MSTRALQSASGPGGGAVMLAADPGRARNIHVTVLNTTAATHGVFFGRSQRELVEPPTLGIAGFAVIAVANTVATATIGTIAYTSFILQAWVGDLWAAADIDGGVVMVDCFDSAYPES